MVRVEVKVRPHGRAALPNWLKSNAVREVRGTYFAIMDIDIPNSSKIGSIPEYVKQQLQERLKTIETVGDIQFRPIEENNVDVINNLGNLMSTMGSVAVANSGKRGKTRKSKAKVIGFEKLFDEVGVVASAPSVKEKAGPRHSISRNRTRRVPAAASAAMNRSRSRSRNRRTHRASRGRSRIVRANHSMPVNSIREMAAAAASSRLREALANAPEARSRSRAKSKTPMMSRPAEERVAIIQNYVKKWYRSLLEKARPSRTERSRSRLRINGVTITPEQEREWRNEEERAQHKIEDAIRHRAQEFYQRELAKYGLPESHNMGFLHGR